MNLRLKFTLSVLIPLSLVIVFEAYAIFSAQKSYLSLQLEGERERSFQMFYRACEEALKSDNERQIDNIINSIVPIHRPAIVYAAFVSGHKKIFIARDDNSNIASAFLERAKRSYASITETFESLTGERIYEYVSPITTSSDKYLGTLIIGFSQDYTDLKVKEGVSVISHRIQMVAVIAFLFALFGANIMAFTLVKPIKLLAIAAKKIGDGEKDVEVDISRGDEIGSLARTFNDMAIKVKEADSMKDSFVSSVSHELRSPLAAIDGYCDFLIDGVNQDYPKEQQLRGLKIIKDAALRLTSFINNILDLAKMRAGKFEMKSSQVDAGEVIREIASLFESLALSQKKTLKYEIADGLPSVCADIEKIKQVITNLLGNALKFTRENDAITISAMLSASYGPEYIEVWVADTGIGLTKADAEKVFEKFYQVKEGEFKKPKGTGLGLSIVYEIIRLHNGRVWAEGELGKGSVFKFALPITGK
ncbi:MAG: HAMP domain-containing histidine kinase [Endomicrobium sp.]|jgi:signal transduction histidine kinase|nr:HAMP domain-containing histidine kinase [Endomicrobium sp.]